MSYVCYVFYVCRVFLFALFAVFLILAMLLMLHKCPMFCMIPTIRILSVFTKFPVYDFTSMHAMLAL